MFVCGHVCMFVRMYVCMYVCMQVCLCLHIELWCVLTFQNGRVNNAVWRTCRTDLTLSNELENSKGGGMGGWVGHTESIDA